MKNYETPKLELVELSECDILTASNGTPFLPYNPGASAAWFAENSGESEIFGSK